MRVRDLCKRFSGTGSEPAAVNSQENDHVVDHSLVLDHINVEFQDGELVCILGPSGCGKTTMVRIIAGFDTPTAGEVCIDGEPVKGPSSDNIFVFQHNGLLPWLTVQENVQLGLRRMKDKDEMALRIEEYIDIVNLSGFERHYPHELSGGMQRRAELALRIGGQPRSTVHGRAFCRTRLSHPFEAAGRNH